MKNTVFIVVCLLCCSLKAQGTFIKKDLKVSALLEGTLYLPDSVNQPPLAIIIAGSGPTDRDGNQPMMKNNSLKYLATGLAAQGIATFTYDKRSVALLKKGQLNEADVQFDDFILDAKSIVAFFKRANEFSKIVLIGHSQGSLIALKAAKQDVDALVSIAGAGQEIDDVIVDQLEIQSPGLKDNARQAFDDLRVNGVAKNYSPLLASIFRPSIQPFIANWMQYNPQELIASLDIPILILNGTRDIQVAVSEAEKLKEAQPNASLILIENMNHILKEVPEDVLENQKTYNNPSLLIIPQVVTEITTFINN